MYELLAKVGLIFGLALFIEGRIIRSGWKSWGLTVLGGVIVLQCLDMIIKV